MFATIPENHSIRDFQLASPKLYQKKERNIIDLYCRIKSELYLRSSLNHYHYILVRTMHTLMENEIPFEQDCVRFPFSTTRMIIVLVYTKCTYH